MQSTPNLRAHFGYPKFKSPPYRLLFPHVLTYELNLQAALLAELRRQGHEVVEQPFRRGMPPDESLRVLLRTAVEVRPDAVLTLNGMGLDNRGRALSTLSKLGLPVVTWYLDHHLFNGHAGDGTPREWAFAFSYESSLMTGLREAGFQHVFYLPLASDPGLVPSGDQSPYASLTDKVTYVGNTFAEASRDYHDPGFERVYAEWSPDFGGQKWAQGRINLGTLFDPYRDRFVSREEFHRFMAYVVARETLRYRVDQLSSLVDDALVVFGPSDWKEHLPEALLRPPVAYQTEAPWVYRSSGINLSLTTLQHETALNQRYYDVPLCGGFLLGEWQESLPRHFEPEEEAVFFRSKAELVDKVRYYRAHPEEKQRIIGRARKRVLREHLMEHRVATLLAEVRRVCRA